jgi:hypothetical protein
MVGNVYVGFAQRRPTEYGLIHVDRSPREFLATDCRADSSRARAPHVDCGDRRRREPLRLVKVTHASGVISWSAMQGVPQLRKLGRFGVAGLALDRLAPMPRGPAGLGAEARARWLTPKPSRPDALAEQQTSDTSACERYISRGYPPCHGRSSLTDENPHQERWIADMHDDDQMARPIVKLRYRLLQTTPGRSARSGSEILRWK